MDTDKVIQDLNRRFAAPLPEFYQRRIIFWYDEDREFEDQIDDIQLDNAFLLKATGTNSFEIKKLLTQNSKKIDERFFGNNSFSLVSLHNGNIQGFSAYYKISNSLCEIFLYDYHFSKMFLKFQ